MADKNIMTMNERIQQAKERVESSENQKTAKKLNKKKANKKKRKGIIISSIALLLAATTGLTTFFMTKNNKKNKPEYEPPKNTITNNIDNDEITAGSLEDLGVKLDFPKDEKKEYTNPSGNIDTSKIVEDEKGTIWVDKEAESKKDEVGKKVTDTNNGEYEEKADGDVYKKDEDYQIVDKDGNVKEEGKLDSDGLPPKLDYDKDTDKILDDGHANTGLYVAPDGSLWGSEQEYLDSLKKEEITDTETEFIPMDPVIVEESPVSNDEASGSQDTSSDSTIDEKDDAIYSDDDLTLNDGVLNADGTYTIWGLTFLSKADFEQWFMNDGEGYKRENGIMVPVTNQIDNQKVLTK